MTIVPTYNKQVRDRIPEIIENSNRKFTSRLLTDAEYSSEITKIMHEELAEYKATEANEDAVEELEKTRLDKAKKLGGFDERIFLIEVEDDWGAANYF